MATIYEHPDLFIPQGGNYWVARCHHCRHDVLRSPSAGPLWWHNDKHQCKRSTTVEVIWG